MNAPLVVGVAGIGAWLRGAPDWHSLAEILRGEQALAADAPAKPSAKSLPASERRRAPDGVRLAVEVAEQACAMADIDAACLPCVFASTFGELAITDYVCETLARAPHELSPTQFHNSVLNAPAGYWTIASGCTVASSAVTAHHRSLPAGLLEAAAYACAECTPVLFASCEVAARGPLLEMAGCTLAFGMALVLTPTPAPAAGARMALALGPCGQETPTPTALALRAVAGDNPANAHALALLGALAGRGQSRLALPLSTGMCLDMEITP